MKYGIISDIHGNLEALEAVLNHLKLLGVEQIINLGDTVGYGASPNECLSLLRKKRAISIMGNHDEAAFNETIAHSFNHDAKEAIDWTKKTVSDNNLEYLQNLPANYTIDNLLFIHGALTNRYGYIKNLTDLQANSDKLNKDYVNIKICFFGHTHRELLSSSANYRIKIAEFKKRGNKIKDNSYFINPGSVGQPRNNNPKSSFLVYDSTNSLIHHYLTTYNIKKAQAKIRAANLPILLAERLDLGI